MKVTFADESRVVSVLLDLAKALCDAITKGQHDDLTVAEVRSLAKDRQLVIALQVRLSEPISPVLNSVEYEALVREWARCAGSGVKSSKWPAQGRGLGLVLTWVLDRLHRDLYAAVPQ